VLRVNHHLLEHFNGYYVYTPSAPVDHERKASATLIQPTTTKLHKSVQSLLTGSSLIKCGKYLVTNKCFVYLHTKILVTEVIK